MTTKSIIAIAAAVAAGLSFHAPAAEAGGGVRLGFGGPLIGFIARPALGYALSPHAHRAEHPHQYRKARSYQERQTPKKHVASRNSDDDKPTKSKKKREEETTEKTDNASSVKQLATNSIPLETTAAPAQSSAPAVLKLDSTAVATPPETEPPLESAALLPSTASTPTTPADAAKPEVKPEPKVEAKSEAKAAKSAEKKSDCRRFVPTAGITISVRCND